jgi:hypothetical protein
MMSSREQEEGNEVMRDYTSWEVRSMWRGMALRFGAGVLAVRDYKAIWFVGGRMSGWGW